MTRGRAERFPEQHETCPLYECSPHLSQRGDRWATSSGWPISLDLGVLVSARHRRRESGL